MSLKSVSSPRINVRSVIAVLITLFLAVLFGLRIADRGKRQSLLEGLPELGSLEISNGPLKSALQTAYRSVSRGEDVGTIAKLFHANGFSNEARLAYTSAMRLDPENPRWPYLAAHLFRDLDLKKEGLALLEKVVGLDPEYVPAWLVLGDLSFDTNNFRRAETAYREALQLSPGNPFANEGVGKARLAQGDPKEALDYLIQAVSVYPELGTAHAWLAQVYNRLEDSVRAAQASESAKMFFHYQPMNDPWADTLHEVRYDVEGLMADVEEARNRKMFEHAVALLKRVVEIDPNRVEARAMLGIALRANDRPQEARPHLTEAHRLDPDNVEVIYELGFAMGTLGRLNEAEALFLEAIEKKPEAPSPHYGLGMVEVMRGNHEKAPNHFRKAAELSEFRYLDAVSATVMMLERVGRKTDAMEFIQIALVYLPELEDMRIRLADFYLASSRYEDAVETLQAGRKLDSANPNLSMRLARVFLEAPSPLGDPEQALRIMEEAIPLCDDDLRPHALSVLAQAQARMGQDAQASLTIQIAIDEATEIGRNDWADEIRRTAARLRIVH